MKKKLILITFTLFCALFFCNCQKNKNCDCTMTGKFVYYKKTEKIIYCGNQAKVNALFISDSVSRFYIIDRIPTEFRTKDTINVEISLKAVEQNGCLTFGVSTVYKIKCIKKK